MDMPLAYHKKPYPAIDPLRPELSQAGKTLLAVGGSTGIGHAIVRNFCKAGATSVIILSRRSDVLETSVAALQKAYPNTKVKGTACDVFKRDEVKKVWDELESSGVTVDVLLLNAVGYPALQPVLEQGIDRLWEDYENNVHSNLYHVERLWKQPGHTKQKVCLYVSTQDIHRWDSAPQMPGYQVSKSACTAALQQIARDTPVDKMQMVSFHPSIVLTEAATSNGYDENTLPWSHEDLPGQFAVWAASAEAKFLHGRFVWSEWDVEELAKGEMRAKIDADPWYLKVGVKGL